MRSRREVILQRGHIMVEIETGRRVVRLHLGGRTVWNRGVEWFGAVGCVTLHGQRATLAVQCRLSVSVGDVVRIKFCQESGETESWDYHVSGLFRARDESGMWVYLQELPPDPEHRWLDQTFA